MHLKDYYKTLGISPTAPEQQVKKSFRMLALQYHPDKNPGNAYAEAKFKEIQEAYETLSNKTKREEYNYKRWYARSLKKQFKDEMLSPQAILIECDRLNNFVSGANVFQVDYDSLSYHIRRLLSDININILQQYNNPEINTAIVSKILQSSSPLPFSHQQPIASLLIRVAKGNQQLEKNIADFLDQSRRQDAWQRYRILAIVLITISICLVIYIISK